MAEPLGWGQKVRSGPPAVTDSVQNLARYLSERDHAGEDVQLCAGARHAVDRTTRFILAKGEAALGVDGFHPCGAIGAHSGQDDPKARFP